MGRDVAIGLIATGAALGSAVVTAIAVLLSQWMSGRSALATGREEARRRIREERVEPARSCVARVREALWPVQWAAFEEPASTDADREAALSAVHDQIVAAVESLYGPNASGTQELSTHGMQLREALSKVQDAFSELDVAVLHGDTPALAGHRFDDAVVTAIAASDLMDEYIDEYIVSGTASPWDVDKIG